MNTDYRISVGFLQHHKTKLLKRRLGYQGIVALIGLWAYAAQFRPDGILEGMSDEAIESAVDWDSDKPLVTCLVEIGFLEHDGDAYRLHDWQEHNPWASEADERSDEARLSRLFRTNAEKAKELRAQGRTGITKEEYQEYKKPAQKYDRSTTVVRPNNDRSTECSTPAPAPAPAPAPIENTSTAIAVEVDSAVAPPLSPPPLRVVKPPCPHQAIVDLYHEVLPELRRCKTLTEGRKGYLRQRWASKPGSDLAKWRAFFEYVRTCPFLMGHVTGSNGRPPFVADLEWLTRPSHFAQIIEGKYEPHLEAKYG